MDKIINKDILVTVLLPVYNAQKHLKESIDSILIQTHKNFELLIINDGSTDNSLEIIRSYADPRIVLINNEINKGLIFSLNRGIDLAKGQYIARMDSDDIALPGRLEIQLTYFEKFPDVSVVCSPIIGITEAGNITKSWDVDLENKTEDQIRDTLSKENCIAHPTVLIKTSVAKKYKYNTSQKGSEDWDLWMRLSSAGHRIVKTSELLLKYRYLNTGITLSDKKKQFVEVKVIKVKCKFILQQFFKFKITTFECKVFYSLLRTIGRHLKLNIVPHYMRNVKRIFTINPFKAYVQYRSLKQFCNKGQDIDIFFFFPYCHIGGAEKVHANIVEVFSDKKVAVFFTGISWKNDFLYLFEKSAPSFNIGFCLNYPWLNSKSERLIFKLINRQKNTIVFGCNNIFFYNSILKFKESVRVIDLMHDFRFEDEENITHSFIEQFFRCEKRIFISSKAIEQTKLFYDSISAPIIEYEKLTLITNYVEVPHVIPFKDYNSKLKILYVGRDTQEKRAYLFGIIAKRCKEEGKDIEFVGIGELKKVITSDYLKYLTLTGPIYDFEKIKEYYKTFHLIIITSEREGFPMAIMEAMAYGMSPISTPVGDVPKYINDKTGFVTGGIMEDDMVNQMVNYLIKLDNDRCLLKSKSIDSYNFAAIHFSKSLFYDSYKKIMDL